MTFFFFAKCREDNKTLQSDDSYKRTWEISTCEVWAYPLIRNRVLTWISYLLFDLGSPSFLAVWFGSLKPLDSRNPNLHCNLHELSTCLEPKEPRSLCALLWLTDLRKT
ncbi:hypothetical protein ILYODFUR_025886 [Ilyodon furcidens]|uniref:Uncharacterized protein n=1 Tax=Ilyodon furcidens TaxID=33524 RepID=A0ABV0UXG8_9TELE